MNLRTECSPFPMPAGMKWSAYDADTYEAACDQEGFFSASPVGYGPTREAAIADFRREMSAHNLRDAEVRDARVMKQLVFEGMSS